MDKSKYAKESEPFQSYLKKDHVIKHSAIDSSPETVTKVDENINYDSVIKQFDDLMFELSDSRHIKKKNSKNVLESSMKNYPVSSHGENTAQYHQSLDLKYKTSNHAEKIIDFKNQSKQPKKADKLPDINLRENILSDVQQRISWINSDLWQFKKEKQTLQIQKPDSIKNITAYNLSEVNLGDSNSKESTVKFSERTKKSPGCSYVFNPASCFRPSQRKDMNYSSYKSSIRYDPKTLSYSDAYFKDRSHLYNTVFVSQGMSSGKSSLRISPKPSRSHPSKYVSDLCFLVKLFIETKDLHLGPFSFEIHSKMTLRLLKLKVEQEHGIEIASQRWILGKCFAVDNEKTIADYNVISGSSIIVYVDNKQKTPSVGPAKTEFGYEKFSSQVNKVTDENSSCKEKERSDSFDSTSSLPNYREATELIRKDSLDSKLVQLGAESKYIHHRKLSNQSSDNSSIDTPVGEQSDPNDLKKGVVSCKVKSPVIKRKILRKNAEPKKKTRIIIHQKLEGESMEKSLLENKNLNTAHGSSDSVNGISESAAKLGLSNLTENKFIQETIRLDNLKNTEGMKDYTDKNLNTDDRFKYLRQEPITEIAKNLIQSNIELKNTEFIFNDVNIEGASENTHVNEMARIRDHMTKTPFFVQNPSNPDQLMIDLAQKVNIENISKVETFSNEKNKNVYESCAVFPINKPENLSQSNLFSVEDENIMNLKESHQECTDKEAKPKRSVTSLIRNISLSRKAKSVYDSSSSQHSNVPHAGVIVQEMNSGHPVLNKHSSLPSDVLIEITPKDQNILTEKESCEYGDCNLQVDPVVHDPESVKNFELLIEIENMDLVENTTHFTCPVCFDEFESGQGVILHDCLHTFCRNCLSSSVNYADSALVKCPYRDDFYSCQSHLQQREIKALVSEDVYEKYLQRSIITAEGLAERSFHCKTPDCLGWCVYEDTLNIFHCPVCSHYNCLNCQAIHEGLNCRQYQNKLIFQQKVDKESEKTLEFLNEMIQRGKALRCPKCNIVLMRKWGCDWLKCSVCKTEICWITKGPRWGPGGQGDTSGGCKCGVNGIKCHPSCTYCH